jgi:hypothetical protein
MQFERREYIAAIQLFVTAKQIEDILKPEELGALKGFDRIRVQRDSLLFNLSRLYEQSPRLDAAPGLLALITFGSDNKEGRARFSQRTIGRILHRNREAIYDAANRLEKANLILKLSRPGQVFAAAPVIPNVLLGESNLIWLTEALSSKTCRDEPSCRFEPSCGFEPPAPEGSNRQDDAKPDGSSRPNLTKRSLDHSESARAGSPRSAPAKQRKTSLAEDWVLPSEYRAYAQDQGALDFQIDFMARAFKRHWTGADAKNALKVDWGRTWENWVDREIARGTLPRQRPTSSANGVHPDLSHLPEHVRRLREAELAEEG